MALPTPALADDEIAGTVIIRDANRRDALRLPPTTRADNSHASTVGCVGLRPPMTKSRVLRSSEMRIVAIRSLYRPRPMRPTGMHRTRPRPDSRTRSDNHAGTGIAGNANCAMHPVGAVREPPTTRAVNCARSSTASLPCVAHIDDNHAGTGIVGNANCAMHPVGAVREPPAFGATTFQIFLSACAGE